MLVGCVSERQPGQRSTKIRPSSRGRDGAQGRLAAALGMSWMAANWAWGEHGPVPPAAGSGDTLLLH